MNTNEHNECRDLMLSSIHESTQSLDTRLDLLHISSSPSFVLKFPLRKKYSSRGEKDETEAEDRDVVGVGADHAGIVRAAATDTLRKLRLRRKLIGRSLSAEVEGPICFPNMNVNGDVEDVAETKGSVKKEVECEDLNLSSPYFETSAHSVVDEHRGRCGFGTEVRDDEHGGETLYNDEDYTTPILGKGHKVLKDTPHLPCLMSPDGGSDVTLKGCIPNNEGATNVFHSLEDTDRSFPEPVSKNRYIHGRRVKCSIGMRRRMDTIKSGNKNFAI
mmetsp:Transcript_4921/g.6665  ORF Transcript_4921/g.6665 Transcript_4921/m.6665 type:complete len:274 (+) Transcript_4921:145-966(+)